MRTVDGETYYYLYNGHADVTALITGDGTIAATYYYDAFGNILESTGEVNNNILYSGYQYDEETGLYYLNARMYDPKIARFLQEDTYVGNSNDPLSLNLYTYCMNSPIIYTDPTGHRPADVVLERTRQKYDVPGDFNKNGVHDQYDIYLDSETKGTGNLVTADQLKEFGWSDTSASFVKKLNDSLARYGITDKNSIAIFMATMAAESGWGKYTLEQGSNAYFKKNGYDNYTRGAGYIQITHEKTHEAFLKSMNETFSGKDTATYIANNYAMEAAAWYWSNEAKTSAGNLNAYVAKNGDSLNIFLVTQYFINGFPTQNGNSIPGFDTDLASIRKGSSYTINKDKNGQSVSLSVNGNTYALPNGWDDREDAYNKAIKAFDI